MKIVIERHTYAPELNKVHFIKNNGVVVGTLPAPGITTTHEWRAANAPAEPFIHVKLRTVYPDPKQKWLERTIGGSVQTRSSALWHKRELEKRLVPNVGARVEVRTSLAYA